MKIAAIFLLAALSHQSSCSNDPTGKPYEEENEIKEISFMGAHQEERCSKGCRYTSVPDTWYILLCRVDIISKVMTSDCFTRSITHSPWSWQKQGTRVVVIWQPRASYHTIISIHLSGTREAVQL